MKIKPQKNELAELLGTPDRDEQVKRLKQLLTAPVIDVVIRVDGRVDQVTGVTVIGGNLTPAVMYRVLDQVRDQVRQAELRAAAQGPAIAHQNGVAVPEPTPPPPSAEPAA